MLRWYATFVVVTLSFLVAGFLCLWPRFNYRLRRSLEPLAQRKRTQRIEQKLREERTRLSGVLEKAQQKHKIMFDLSGLDADGLRGPPDGKVAVSYEFAIPNTQACKDEVKAIDRTVQFMPGSPGRVAAGKDECLCIGATHQEAFREVLESLAARPYIETIIECHFE